MGLAVDLGTGTTLTFGTSSFSVQIIDVNLPGANRVSVPVPHMGTAAAGANQHGNIPKLPGDLVDPGQLAFTGHFDPDSDPPIGGAPETITVTFPLGAGEATASNWVGTGFMVSMDNAIPLDGAMTADFVVEFSGNITRTDAT